MSDERVQFVDVGGRRAQVVREVDIDLPLATALDVLRAAGEGLDDPHVNVYGEDGGGTEVEVTGWRDATDEEVVRQIEATARYEKMQAALRQRMNEHIAAKQQQTGDNLRRLVRTMLPNGGADA